MKKVSTIQFFVYSLFCCLGFINSSLSQTQPSVAITASKNEILLGEQIELEVQAKIPATLHATELFRLPDTLQHLEVLRRGPIDSSLDGSIKLYRQSFTITGFDSGTWAFPAVAVKIRNNTYRSQPLPITILPVALPDSSYHDIREIIAVAKPPVDWWFWVVAVLSAILLSILVWLWWKSRTKKRETAGAVQTDAPGALAAALQQLKELQQQQLPEKGALTAYYSGLGDIVRRYIQQRFGVRALQHTTDELLVQLHSTLRNEQPGKLAALLRIADAVKFAKFRPDTDQCSTDMENASLIIKAMDTLK